MKGGIFPIKAQPNNYSSRCLDNSLYHGTSFDVSCVMLARRGLIPALYVKKEKVLLL